MEAYYEDEDNITRLDLDENYIIEILRVHVSGKITAIAFTVDGERFEIESDQIYISQ